ncbi:putative holin-like toxin [Bacillus velezensis]|nr:putative holin-like toxin [Bacillus velezensis]
MLMLAFGSFIIALLT